MRNSISNHFTVLLRLKKRPKTKNAENLYTEEDREFDISVKGNDGTIALDSIAFSSLNTNDSDISSNGVKLFASNDTKFNNAVQIGSGKNFTDGTVNFYNLNHELPTGLSALWLTYDIKDDLSHELQNHILDAYIPENGIKISDNYFPVIDQSPIGNRTIAESIFYDNLDLAF